MVDRAQPTGSRAAAGPLPAADAARGISGRDATAWHPQQKGARQAGCKLDATLDGTPRD